jgi:hypothetical protein
MSDKPYMKEPEIAAIEATAADYGLENYPISGAQLSALIETLRFYEKGANLGMPHVVREQNRAIYQEISGPYGTKNFFLFVVGIVTAFLMMFFVSPLLPLRDALNAGGVRTAVAVCMALIPAFIPISLMLWLMARNSNALRAEFDKVRIKLKEKTE